MPLLRRHWYRRPLFRPTAAAVGAVPAVLAALICAGAAAAEEAATPADEKPGQPSEVFAETVAPFLQKYCSTCHGEERQEAGVDFHRLRDFAAARKDRRTWEKTVEMLEAGAMPPDDAESRPADEDTEAVLAWIHSMLHIDCSEVHDPGRVTIRRLNRAEYNNTIRDLLGIDFRPARDFPSDDVGYGFDNIGDVLSLPPLLMERYMDAAEEIAAIAVAGDGEPGGRIQRRDGRELSSRGRKHRDSDGFYHLNSAGNVFGEFDLRVPGEYVVAVEAAAQQAGTEPARMLIRAARKDLQTHDIQGDRTPGVYETKLVVGGGQVGPGRHRISAAFINDYYQPDAGKPNSGDRNLLVRAIEVRGPLPSGDEAAQRQKLIFVEPGPEVSAESAARSIFEKFASRAYRRPVEEDELNGLVALAAGAVEAGEPFERAVQLGVQAVLVSPHFLFRAEFDRHPDNPGEVHRVSDYELASRLSYFLWSSMPDDALFELAAAGTLHEPAVLERQVERMLDDPKSASLVRNFGGQWLNLGLLDQVTPDPGRFGDFNDDLRADMRRETELLFEAVLRENRSIFDFLDADFTFVNERLAKHYGIEGVAGDEFRRVSLKDTQRAGVLTHASILTLTSDPEKTKPVKRGKWILENILGTAPPPPPPDVPALAETEKANPEASLREQLALHRSNANCASCHEVMDPLGLGFEHFDAIGRWREKDGDRAIDSSGSLPSGETFNDARELIRLVRRREFDYSRHFTETMLTFALGRGLEYYDACTVGRVVDAIADDDYRIRRLVTEIVKSDAFLKRRGDGGQP